MKIATAHMTSVSPYSQSRMHDEPKMPKEGADEYEKRTWKKRLHVAKDGKVYIPPMSFKMGLDAAAKFMSRQIPGKGKSTYTKHFTAGVLVMDGPVLPYHQDDVHGEWFFMNADGVRGSGKRVKRCYPVIPDWSGKVEFYVADDTITKDVFEEHLAEAGKFIGIGRFRPQNGGFYGRFTVDRVDWSEQ